MPWLYLGSLLVLGTTVALLLVLIGYIWWHRTAPSALVLLGLTVAVTQWTISYLLEIVAADAAAKLLYAKLQYLGITSAPLAWWIFALRYTGKGAWLRPWSIAPLLIVPLVTVTLVFTNEAHGLIWSQVGFSSVLPLSVLDLSYGPWFWVHTLFSYLLMLLGSVRLGMAALGARRLYRWQAGLLLLGAATPWIGNALHIFRLSPLHPLDLTPLGFALAALLVSQCFFRFHLLDLVPVAHSAIVEGSRDGIIVLDAQNRVIDMNPVAERITGHRATAALNRPIERLLPGQPEVLDRCRTPTEAYAEVTLTDQGRPRTYDAHIVPLLDRSGQLSGRLVLLHDITERKRAAEMQRFLAEAGTLLAGSLDYETTLATVAQLAVPYLGDWCSVYILDTTNVLRCVAMAHKDPAKRELLHELQHQLVLPPDAPYGPPKAVRTSRPELALNITAERLAAVVSDPTHRAALRELGACSALIVPLIARGRTIGAISFASATPLRYGPPDLALAEELARRAALAVDNALLYHQSQRRLAELTTVQRVAQAINSNLHLDAIFQTVVNEISTAFGYQLVSIYLRQGDGLALQAYVGYDDVKHFIRLDQGVSGRVARTGQAAFVRDATQDPDFIVVAPGTRQAIIAPLKIGDGQVLGTLAVESTGVPELTSDDFTLVTLLAEQVSVAVANARLFAELQASEQRYRAIVEDQTELICRFLPDGTLTFVNEAYSRSFGKSRQELIGHSFLPFVPAEDRQALEQHLAALGPDRPVAVIEHRAIAPDGTIRWQRWTDRAICDEHGQIVEFQSVGSDITERKQAEEQLRRQNEELNALYATTLDLLNQLDLDRLLEAIVARAGALLDTPHGYLYLVDPDGTTMTVRIAVGIFSGYAGYRLRRGEGLSGRIWETGQPLAIDNYRAWPERQHDLDCMGLRALMGVPLRSGNSFAGVLGLAYVEADRTFGEAEIALLSRFGQLASLALENARLYSAAQQELGERRRTEEALRKSEAALQTATRAKSDFLANMSHEIRTPMSAVIGMTDLLLATSLNAEQREFARTIRASGDALLALIDDILDLSKIESGKLELEYYPLSLRACLEESIGLVALKAAEKQLDISYTIAPQTPEMLIGDGARLRQILVNLLSNAVKFTEAGEILIAISAQPHVRSPAEADHEPSAPDAGSGPRTAYELRFAVHDTGIGIPPDRLDRLFQSFSQVDPAIRRKYGGTGLGLAIAKRLTELMGGTMGVESEVGRGSTFYFTIIADAIPDPGPIDTRAAPPALAGKRLLVVGASVHNRRMISSQAQGWGMIVRDTASGAEALAWIRQGEPFDVAVLDARLADMDGLSLAAQIRNDRDAQALPLILLTSLAQREEGLRAIRTHFRAYLHKPIKLSQLQAVLNNIFEERAIAVAAPAAPVPPAIPRAGAAPVRILLAEDNPINQRLILLMLQSCGYQADVVSDGLEALRAVERQPYDIVLLDVQMPEMDGLEVARSICQRWPREERPYLIAVTAYALRGDREMCLNAGMDDYITKPVRLEELIAAIEQGQARRGRSPAPAARAPVVAPALPAPARSTAVTLDSAVLESFRALLSEEQQKQLPALIADYLANASQLLESMRAAAVQGDLRVLEQAAHQLKASSGMFGAMRLAALCGELEASSRASRLTGCQELVAQLEAELACVRIELERAVGVMEPAHPPGDIIAGAI